MGRYRRRLALVTAVWVLGFGIGAATHLFELITAGMGVYADAPEPVRWFWVALTVVDPVIVVLLLVRRRAGVLSGVTTMVADVLVNWSAAFAHPALAGPGLVTQPAFLLFLLLTARPLWRSAGATRPRRRHPDG
ncbi:hypothetical protein DEI99_000700 [Curtobacterium sp. MCLR17_036]|uniref:hypothetical protein n=1 Tax=Curtobacterium sp. MCLR17_036 TaxID=2175620 RepID=UPI000DA99204|nr:hypothetical protein [Curtobacterium sp. MCLR17_036]WIE65078.1 hypothetical protein DEI99_000700 [Curtobacterium sp. MCLR17_036]